MKNKYFYLLIVGACLFLLPACRRSFEDLTINKNKPASVPASLLFNGILNKMYDPPAGQLERWDQYFLINYDYYGNNRYDFGTIEDLGGDYFLTLENVVKMEEEAQSLTDENKNAYSALAKFFKAYFYTKMSLETGDLPLTDALEGLKNLTPAYNTQKEIFEQAFLWLDSANTQMAASIATGTASISGDIYFGNDLTKWRKTFNTLRLRLLIELSKKADDPDLNVKAQFAKILGDPATYPVMESADDNLQFVSVHPTNDYPENPGSFGFNALRENTSNTYIHLLDSLQDPRVFVTAEPAASLVAAGASPTSFAAFLGADPGEDLGVMYVKANAGGYSLINRHYYYSTYTGEPSVQIGFPEMCFNIAEAINRGWATSGVIGTAADYYKAGIQASMASYGIPQSGNFTVYFLIAGSPGSTATYTEHSIPFDFTTYYNQATVTYTPDANGLVKIIDQKYLAMFRHSGLEAYFNWRRTGYPNFTTGAGTGNSGRVALRFQYSASEKSANVTNYEAALTSQYGGNDDINGKMWLLQ